MDKEKADTLRQEILTKVKEYYQLVLSPESREPFIPGESRINYAGRVFDEREVCNLVDSALEFYLTYGRFSREFERKFADTLQVRHALLVNSGSSANLLAFATLTSPLLGDRQIRRGDEVITVACGFPTTVSPILQYGAIPVFVDVGRNSANIDATMLEKALSPRTKAVMLAHTLGNPFDLKAVKTFCDRHRLWLIEDNCDALGSRYDGRFTGTWGDLGTSSFYPPHHLTMGEGGACYTSDPLLYKIARSFRDWGRECWCDSGKDNSCGCRFTKQFGTLPFGYDHKYVYSHFGFNLKATEMQAAVGCAQLEKLPDFTMKRKANFRYLYDHLKDLEEFSSFEKLPEADPSWFGFLLILTDQAGFTRNELAQHLEKNNVQTRNLFAGNLLRHPCFEPLTEGVDYRVCGKLENTDLLMNQALWIGVYPGMGQEKLDHMIKTIREFCRK